MTIQTFDDACRAVLRNCPNGYAKAYAEAGFGMTGHEAYVQSLYIRNNIQHWRGDLAKEVRGFLKSMEKTNAS